MDLTAHFSLAELTFSSTAVRLQIPNDPPADVLANLRRLADGLEQIRTLLGDRPLHIDSGYRSTALNKAVNGAPSSAHLAGFAADFTCAAYGTPAAIVARLRTSMIRYDQAIEEGTWVHVSFDPRERRQALAAHFGPNGTRYTPMGA